MKDWNYCTKDDRRVYLEYTKELGILPSQPFGSQLDTIDVRQIPKGTYDTTDGYFDPKTNELYNYEGEKIRLVTDKEEREWIMKYCRKVK